MESEIKFALQHLKFLLSTIQTRQRMMRAKQNIEVEARNFANAASLQGILEGLTMTETMVRDQIRGLEIAQKSPSETV